VPIGGHELFGSQIGQPAQVIGKLKRQPNVIGF
jgi:hypothetical protein